MKKHAATVAKAKENAKRRKPPSPQPSQSSSSSEEKIDSPSQTNPETQNQENPDGSLTQTQTEIVGPENPKCGGDREGPNGVAPDENEEGPSSVAPDEDDNDDGGPVDKSVLISFKDHIAYAIWNRTQEVPMSKGKQIKSMPNTFRCTGSSCAACTYKRKKSQARVENPSKGCTALIVSLEQKVQELQSRVTALEALQSRVTTLEARLGESSSANQSFSFAPPISSTGLLSLAENEKLGWNWWELQNNHAVGHYNDTGYLLAVKLGTITYDLEGAVATWLLLCKLYSQLIPSVQGQWYYMNQSLKEAFDIAPADPTVDLNTPIEEAKPENSIDRVDAWLAGHQKEDGTVLPSAKPLYCNGEFPTGGGDS
ncbi:hypothetical protein LguiA_023789 [Lonicera macranthoides]